MAPPRRNPSPRVGPRPTRREGESRASYNRRVAAWTRTARGGRNTTPRPDPSRGTGGRGGGGRGNGGRGGTGFRPGRSGGGPSDRERTGAQPPRPRRRGGERYRPGPYGAGGTYNTGNPGGFDPGTAPGSVVWDETGVSNEPGYGDADRPTVVRYDARQAMEWLLNLSVTNPGAYADMAYQLWQAGFLGGTPEEIIGGAFSMEVGDAFMDLYDTVNTINASGSQMSIFDYLANRVQGRVESGALGPDGGPLGEEGGAGPEGPPPRSYTDPETLQASARAAAEEVIGRRLTDAEVQKFSAKFRGLEDSAYDKRDADQAYAAPDVGGQSEEFVENSFKPEASMQRGGNYVQALQRMVLG